MPDKAGMNCWCAGVLLLCGFDALSPAQAGEGSTLDDDWNFQGVIYGYFPTFGGSTSFPTDGDAVDVSAEAILDSLESAFMGTFEAGKGPWGAFGDVMYLNLGASRSGVANLTSGGAQLPAGITADASLDVDGWLWTLGGKYRVLETPDAAVDVFAGTRIINLQEELSWTFSGETGPIVGPGQQGTSEASVNFWDGVVGVKGRLRHHGSAWYGSYYLDVGTGESDFTWQGIAGMGYSFGWGDIIVAWKYVRYDFESGNSIENLDLNGPGLGVALRW